MSRDSLFVFIVMFAGLSGEFFINRRLTLQVSKQATRIEELEHRITVQDEKNREIQRLLLENQKERARIKWEKRRKQQSL